MKSHNGFRSNKLQNMKIHEMIFIPYSVFHILCSIFFISYSVFLAFKIAFSWLAISSSNYRKAKEKIRTEGLSYLLRCFMVSLRIDNRQQQQPSVK